MSAPCATQAEAPSKSFGLSLVGNSRQTLCAMEEPAAPVSLTYAQRFTIKQLTPPEQFEEIEAYLVGKFNGLKVPLPIRDYFQIETHGKQYFLRSLGTDGLCHARGLDDCYKKSNGFQTVCTFIWKHFEGLANKHGVPNLNAEMKLTRKNKRESSTASVSTTSESTGRESTFSNSPGRESALSRASTETESIVATPATRSLVHTDNVNLDSFGKLPFSTVGSGLSSVASASAHPSMLSEFAPVTPNTPDTSDIPARDAPPETTPSTPSAISMNDGPADAGALPGSFVPLAPEGFTSPPQPDIRNATAPDVPLPPANPMNNGPPDAEALPDISVYHVPAPELLSADSLDCKLWTFQLLRDMKQALWAPDESASITVKSLFYTCLGYVPNLAASQYNQQLPLVKLLLDSLAYAGHSRIQGSEQDGVVGLRLLPDGVMLSVSAHLSVLPLDRDVVVRVKEEYVKLAVRATELHGTEPLDLQSLVNLLVSNSVATELLSVIVQVRSHRARCLGWIK